MLALSSSKRVLPGFGLSLGSSLFYTCLILLLPLTALVMQLAQMSLAQYWEVISNPQVVAAYKVTLLAAGVASLFNAVFGMLMARILTRYRFPGRSLLDGLIDLPFALPTAVAGLTLAGLFSTTGWYGQWLAHFDIKVTFTAWDRGSDGVHQPAVCGAHRAAGSGRAGAGIRRGCRDAGRYALAEFPPRGVARGGTGIAGRHRHLLYPQPGRVRRGDFHRRQHRLEDGSDLADDFRAFAGV